MKRLWIRNSEEQPFSSALPANGKTASMQSPASERSSIHEGIQSVSCGAGSRFVCLVASHHTEASVKAEDLMQKERILKYLSDDSV
jgi:hypothetical protein